MTRSLPAPRSKRLVFENDFVEALVLRFKRNRDFGTFYHIARHCKNLVDSIILGSRFNRSVPFQDLVGHVFLQMERWIDRWTPGQGTLYSYLSICTKHCNISAVTKEQTLRQRMALLGDTPMEAIGGGYTMDFEGLGDLADNIRESVQHRWEGDPEVCEAVKYAVEETIVNGGIRNRKTTLTTMVSAFDLGSCLDSTVGKAEVLEVAKFILDWASAAVRTAWIDHHGSPIRAQDVLRLQSKFSFLPDMVNIVGVDGACKLLAVFAGMSVRFPTAAMWQKMCTVGSAYQEYLSSSGDYDVVTRWAKKAKMPAEKMAALLQDWAINQQAGVLYDAPVQ